MTAGEEGRSSTAIVLSARAVVNIQDIAFAARLRSFLLYRNGRSYVALAEAEVLLEALSYLEAAEVHSPSATPGGNDLFLTTTKGKISPGIQCSTSLDTSVF